jgi:phenylacetate-coenzyme A ligase PaaK-like adenylate-forming protein
VYSRREWAFCVATLLRWNLLAGIRPRLGRRLRVATVGATSPLHVSARLGMAVDIGLYRMLRLDARRPVEDIAAALDAFRPDVLIGYASALALLAHEQARGRLGLRPSTVATTSEVRSPEMELVIRRAWGVQPYQLYGITEGGVLAGDCDRHTGMHVFEDLFIVECVDEHGHPVPDGTLAHQLLLTNLFNRTQPLIRCRVSDMVVVDSRPCACGRTLRRVVAVDGRNDDIVRLSSPTGAVVAVHPSTLRAPFLRLAGVRQYQVLHDRVGLHVRVVPAPGTATSAIAGEVREAIETALVRAGAQPPPVSVELVPTIHRDQGHGAKLRLVQSGSR